MQCEPNTAVGLTLQRTLCRTVWIFKKIKTFTPTVFTFSDFVIKSPRLTRICTVHTQKQTRVHMPAFACVQYMYRRNSRIF